MSTMANAREIKFYRQATNKIAGISAVTAAFLDQFFLLPAAAPLAARFVPPQRAKALRSSARPRSIC